MKRDNRRDDRFSATSFVHTFFISQFSILSHSMQNLNFHLFTLFSRQSTCAVAQANTADDYETRKKRS